jgi:hypothetical protein
MSAPTVVLVAPPAVACVNPAVMCYGGVERVAWRLTLWVPETVPSVPELGFRVPVLVWGEQERSKVR